jgi:methyltransferase
MVSAIAYTIFITLTAIERLIEVRISNRNANWSFEQGGIEKGKGHYPFMVFLHTGFLFACLAEVWLLEREFDPILGYPMLALAILCQLLRWWCISSLGKRWNTRVILVPGLPRLTNGPYRFFSHPNYVAVVLEGLAIPLLHSAYWTAIGFTILNAGLLYIRISCEESALQELLGVNNGTE